MNKLKRQTAVDENMGLSRLMGPNKATKPTMRGGLRALTDTEMNAFQSNTSNGLKPNRVESLERQRNNAEKLSRGYSVAHVEGKENSRLVKQTGDVLKNLTLKDNKKKEVTKRFPLKPQVTVVSENLFKLPAKPVKEKKRTLVKAESVTTLCIPKPAVVSNSEKVECEPTVTVIPIEFFDDEDIKYENDELLLGIYAKDIYRFLRKLESEQSVRESYITKGYLMTPGMRTILVDWMYEVQDVFQMLQETIQMAISFLDRFLQNAPNVAKDELQLVGVACIFMASKYEEVYGPSADDLVLVSANACNKTQILQMEQRIARQLKFKLGRPPPIVFLRRFSRVANIDSIIYTFSKFFCDLAMVHYPMAHLLSSMIAAAALFTAIYISTEDPVVNTIWSQKLVYYTEYTFDKIEPTVRQLAKLISNINRVNCKCIIDLYKNEKRHSVTERPELTSPNVMKLANGI